MEMAWTEDGEQSRKRKREWRSSPSPSSAAVAAAAAAVAAGDGGDNQSINPQHNQQQQQMQRLGQQDLNPNSNRSQWIDLNTSRLPLPPGWEQCLDLQTGKMYFVNWATQSKTLQDPRVEPEIVGNSYMGQTPTSSSNNIITSYSNHITSNPLYGTMMMQTDAGYHHHHHHHHYQPPLADDGSKQSGIMDRSQTPAIVAPNVGMSTTICLHCFTFVMIPHSSPQCPNCKNACNIGLDSSSTSLIR